MRLTIVFLFPVLASAQEDAIAMGATLFRTHCAVVYCHGTAGNAGRAPQLAGRSFATDRLVNIIRDGIPKTGMPGFKDQMRDDGIRSIALYVRSLSGPAATESAKPESRALPVAAKEGRALFFDATRMGGCGTCHAADGWGVPIGPSLTQSTPENAAALRAYQSTRVKRSEPEGEAPFAALPVITSASVVTLYDLSTPLPVLRTFAAGKIRLTSGADWNHAGALRPFSDAELESILTFLRAVR